MQIDFFCYNVKNNFAIQWNYFYANFSEKEEFFDYIQFGFLETPVLKFDLEVGGNPSLEV